MKRVAVIVLAAGIAVLAALAWAFRGGSVPDELKIGVGQPLTGPLSRQGEDLLRGVQLAVEEINASGGARIGDRRVRLSIVAADDKSNAAEGVAAAQKLVDAGVFAAIAHLNSGVSIPAAPVYARAGIPQLAISTNPAYTRQGLPTTFRLVANDDMQSKAIASYALKMPGTKRIALVDDGTPYGRGLAELSTKLFADAKRSIDLRRTFDDRRTDFDALVADLKQERIDLIIAVLSDFQVVALIDQMAAAGLTNISLLGADNIKTDALAQAGQKIHALMAASPISEPREFLGGKTFVERYRARFGNEPIYGAHYTYDAVYVLMHALAVNGSIDKVKLLQRLHTLDGNAPVTTTMRFDEIGEQRYGSIGIYRQIRGRWDLETRTDLW